MKHLYYIAWLITSATILVSCGIQDFFARQDTAVIANNYKDPHTDCEHCHGILKPEGEKGQFPPSINPSTYCLDCHKYSVNHHPVNFVPATPLKAPFPLYNGEITCLTCHEIHGGPQHKRAPMLLRGEPYSDRRNFCFNCHDTEQYANINPHVMKESDDHRVVVNGKPVCLLCHEVEPDPSHDTANIVLFKADIDFLCLRCHTLMHAEFFEKHFLVTPPKEIMNNIDRPEIREKFSLPLVPRGHITCATCHNPHQKGIISYGPAAAGADSFHRLRDQNICAGCHL